MHLRRLLTGVCLMAALVMLPLAASTPVSVRALSCVPLDVLDELREAEFAFVGRVAAKAGGMAGAGDRRIHFTVERWVKGDLGPTVTVHGFDWSDPQLGDRLAMIVRLEGGVLRMNECLFTDPETLLAMASLTGQPESAEPAAILIGGEFGTARLMGLDARGRLVGFGAGQGWVHAISVCPDGRRSVELAQDWRAAAGPSVVVRDLATLQIVNEVRITPREDGGGTPESLVCRDAEGSDVLVALAGVGIAHLATGELVQGGRWTVAALSPGVAVVREPEPVRDGELERFTISMIDLATGELTELRPPPAQAVEVLSITISPDGTHAAIVEQDFFLEQREGVALHLFDLTQGSLVGTLRIPGPRACDGCSAEALWVDAGSLIVRSQAWDEAIQDVRSVLRTFRVPELEQVAELAGGRGTMGHLGGGLLFGLEYQPGGQKLVATSLESGQLVDVRVVPTSNATALVVLSSFDEAAAERLLAGPDADPSPTTTPGSATIGPSGSAGPTVSPAPGGSPPPGVTAVLWIGVPLIAILFGVTAGGLLLLRRRSR